MDDPNEDLSGYEYEIRGDPPSRWRVVGSDPVLGANYVQIRRVADDGQGVSEHPLGMRVQVASQIRRRKQLEATSC